MLVTGDVVQDVEESIVIVGVRLGRSGMGQWEIIATEVIAIVTGLLVVFLDYLGALIDRLPGGSILVTDG